MDSIIVEKKGLAWEKEYYDKLVSVKAAAAVVKSGDHIGTGQASCAPDALLKELCLRKDELRDVEIYSGLIYYPYDFMKGEFKGHIGYNTYFLSPTERKFMHEGNISVSSHNLTNHEDWFGRVGRCNVALLEVTAPDENGYFSYGVCGALMNPAIVTAVSTIIVQVNKRLPTLHNNMKETLIHVSEVSYICEADYPILEVFFKSGTEIEQTMASYIVDEIPDGACLQIGIGGVPNSICELLTKKQDLGVHSEMISDGIMKLAKNGNINNSRKNIDTGKFICGGAMASMECYNWMASTEDMICGPSRYINNPMIIAQNDNVIAINSAIQVDLTGQISSESIGYRQYSGTGGQLEFAIGARYSKGGKSFIALPSTVFDKKTNTLKSRIVISLDAGSAVTTPRSFAHYIVTEYGMVNVKNRSFSEIAKLLISIAHPDFREQLTQEATKVCLI